MFVSVIPKGRSTNALRHVGHQLRLSAQLRGSILFGRGRNHRDNNGHSTNPELVNESNSAKISATGHDFGTGRHSNLRP